jgi:molybdenum cofactor synthesis domain-containing protein
MFRKLLTLNEAKNLIDNLGLKALGSESVSLLKTHSRVLAEDIVSTFDIPPFDRSTVDGYAVKAEDTSGAEENQPVKLRNVGAISVGELPVISLEKGEAVEIVTGAPIPNGADAVVMVEDTEKKGENVEIFNSVAKNDNVMRKGTDIRKGENVLRRGQPLGSREMGVIAALGKARISVFLVPKVAVLSTGAEVTQPGHDLPPGKIYDINAFSLAGAVLESGGEPIYIGVAPDEKTKLYETLEKAIAQADVVVTSAGVSVGPKDLIPQTIDSLGKPGLVFSGIAVKPGKPTTMALIGKKPVFALPGHPASALLIFHLIVRPVIQRLAGKGAPETETIKTLAGTRMFSAKGRRTFVMVNLRRDRLNRIVAEPVETGASGAIMTLAKADGYLEIPENLQFIDENDEVVVTLFDAHRDASASTGYLLKECNT